MGLTPAPVNAWFLAWIALAPLWVLIVGRSSSAWLPVALAWGVGYHGLALFWITGIHPMTWMGVNWWVSLAIAAFAWSFITLWGAGIVVAWAWGMRRLERFWHSPANEVAKKNRHAWLPVLARVLTGIALWCVIESLWSMGSLYWTSISYTQSPYNLAILHLGQVSGAMTVTAAIVAVNALLGEAWLSATAGSDGERRSPLIQYAAPIVLCVALHAIGLGLYWRPLNDAPNLALKVGIIQGNIPNTIKLFEDGWRRSLTHYTDGYQALADQGVDAVLTPETALPIQWLGELRKRTAFYQAVVERGIPVWLGAFGGDGRAITNSRFTIAGDGATLSEYRKFKLVPLGEYIPFEQVLGRLIDRLSPLDAHMIPGRDGQVFDTPFGRAIAAICYESAFPEVFRYQAASGGQFIVTASNNAHYSTTMPAQHHAQDVMRAIETDRWAARATNTGYSGIVDPHGQTIWLSGINTYEIHAGTIYRRQTQTLYVRWGDWLTPLWVGMAIVALLLQRRST